MGTVRVGFENIKLFIMGVVRTCIGDLHVGNECSWHLPVALRDHIEPSILVSDAHRPPLEQRLTLRL